MADKIFGLDPKLVGAAALLLVLAPLVIYLTVRSGTQMVGSRAIYKDFAGQIGVNWSPPKNEADTLGPGRVKGRYLGHKLSIDTTAPTGAARNQLSETVIRVHFSRSLGLGLNGGSGTFRARNPGELELSNAELGKLLRPKAKDEAGARRLLDDPQLAAAILELGASTRGVAIDDGTLSCAVPLPTSTTELQARVDAVVNVVEQFNRVLAQ